MADIRSIRSSIRLLTDHDVVNEAGGPRILCRKPRHADARHVLLKALEERHKIPDCKDVIPHEAPEVGGGNNVCVKLMLQQCRTKAAKLVVVVFRHV